jgi:hypothetical protein
MIKAFTRKILAIAVVGYNHIQVKLIIHRNVAYQAGKGLYVFCTRKNLLNNKSTEFFTQMKYLQRYLQGITMNNL